MASVQGIGGVFIDSEDAPRLVAWYGDVLGIQMEGNPEEGGYFTVFYTRDPESSILRENPVFAINQVDGGLAKDGRGFVINLRVDHMDAFLEQIRAKGVEIEGKLLEWERGKHARIRDIDGNRIELYEEILAA